MKIKNISTTSIIASVILIFIFGICSTIAQNITTPAATTEVKKNISEKSTTQVTATAPETTPPVVSTPIVNTPEKEVPTQKTPVPVKEVTVNQVKPAEAVEAPVVTKSTVKPVTTTTAAPKPTVAKKSDIKPATALKPEVTESKLPSTVISKAPGYSSSKSSSDWMGNIINEYNTMHELLGDRIHIGLRRMSFSLDETSRVGQDFDDYFLGTIDELHEVQDTSLANVTLGFYPIRNLGVEYRRDEVRAKTTTDTDNNHSDGDFVVDGPVFLAVARLPLDQAVTLFNMASGNDTADHDTAAHNFARRFIPYIGLGIAGLSGSFEADTWWGNGYSSPESWEALGSPEGIIRNGHTRAINVTDEDVGMYLVYGISIRIIDNFFADFSFSKVDVDLTADFVLDEVYQYTRTIPMSYTSTSIGIRYYF